LALTAVSSFQVSCKLPLLLRLATIPFCTFNFWFKLLLHINNCDYPHVYTVLVSNNNFINLMIVPAIALLHVQLQKKD
jgi:hypothetical protein